jgi:hypothetical protein
VDLLVSFVAKTDKFLEFLDECRCIFEGSGDGSVASAEALWVADFRRIERPFPKGKVEPRRNQVPITETADLRATAINFCGCEKLYLRLTIGFFYREDCFLSNQHTSHPKFFYSALKASCII